MGFSNEFIMLGNTTLGKRLIKSVLIEEHTPIAIGSHEREIY